MSRVQPVLSTIVLRTLMEALALLFFAAFLIAAFCWWL